MIQSDLLVSTVWIIFIFSGILITIVPLKLKSIIAVFCVVYNAIITSYISIPALSGSVVEISLFSTSVFGNIPIRIDSLSAWFIIIINFTSVTGVIYGNGYMKMYKTFPAGITLHWFLFILFHLSMVMVCMVQNGFVFLIVWEIMSLSSMMLVIFDHNNSKTLKAGINYLIQMHLSIAFLTIGFIWVYSKTGSFSFEAIETFFSNNNNIWLFLVFFIGFGLKAGFIPLHSWLPHAHPAAPSHISGVMSGVIVKLGIYGIFRIISLLKSDYLLLGEIIIIISLLTALYGILNAAVHRDFKRMLAYCTIENIGIIGLGIGIGLIGIGTGSAALYYLGFGGSMLHVLNHSLFKSLLFYSAGSVYQQTHTRDMDKLGGLVKKMPKTASIFLIGSVAIAGLPPFNGFVSEFIIYNGLLEGVRSGNLGLISLLILSFAGLSIVGGLSILTFTKTFGTIFLGNERIQLQNEPGEVSLTMLLPQYIIIAIMLTVGLFPQFYLKLINNIILVNSNINIEADFIFKDYASTIRSITIYSFGLAGIICLVWIIRSIFLRSKVQTSGVTWGCGYTAPTSRLQYTGKSFSKPLAKTFNFILIEKKKFRELKNSEIFPLERKYSSDYLDFFEHHLFEKFTQRLVFSANYFKFIQNGKVQTYVLYGIIFILSIIFATALNFF